ncbi:NADP-dependent malic enzyme [Klebsiella pneumoniae]|uniref:NADP-dependent malic enzyme n=1 Tax=Klebsiella pneumoniae TaxID=573 RepID=A0A2X3GYL3_KLEPN|nr:NADP-dependent malic enzyme [Klebsiella pneumoniae]
MKLAAVHAIAELAHAEQSEVVASAYGDQDLSLVRSTSFRNHSTRG